MLASTVSAFVGWFRGWVVGFGGGGCPSVLSRSSVPCLAGGLLRRYLLYERRFVIHKRELPQTMLMMMIMMMMMMMMMVMMLMAVTVKSAPPHTLRPVFLGPVRGNSARCSDRFLSETVPPSLSNCAFWRKFSGANFCFFAFGSGRCFLVLFCLCFCFIMWHCSPESRLKNSLLVRRAFWEKFSGANFCFLAFVSGWCFLVLFCLCFCFIMWHCSPESRLKNSLLVRCAFWEKFSERTFVF